MCNMKYGIHLFATEDSIQPGELAQEAEARGYDSVLFSEHTHMPVNFLNARNLNSYYWQTYDPFIAATMAAASSTRIKVGTGVSLVLQHDPIALAKQIATIDQVSGGRMVLGIGAGWIADEMANHGISYSTRYRYLDEYVKALKSIWTEDESEFSGEYINFGKMKSYPKPAQSPYPPLISGGGTGPKTLDFVAKHCDGWMPLLGIPDWPEIKEGIMELHKRLETYGRQPSSVDLSIFTWAVPDEETLVDMEASGITAIVTSLEAKTREEALPLLDTCIK